MNQTFTRKRPVCRFLTIFRFIFLFYLTFICISPASAYAQGMRFSISAKRITVLEVFKLMKLQHQELGFFYNNDLFDPTRKVDINVSEASLDELMAIVLGGKYAWELQDDHIVIKPLQKSNLQAQASVKTITGLVKDKDGIPLSQVLIRAFQAKTSTTTDLNGRFLIRANEDDILTFNYLGCKKQEVNVKGINNLNITMQEDVSFLTEVLVTGYQTLSRKNAPGSYVIVDKKELEARNNRTIEGMLEGLVPGLSVYKGGNGLNDLRIRGGSSLRAGTQPLIVIDGFVSTIFPDINEIENVSVLKDAAASAVWGSQAANGVIVITTKKGKNGKMQINYSGNARIMNQPDYDKLHRADAASLIDYQKEQYDRGYIEAAIFDGSKSGYSQSIGIFNDYNRAGGISLEERDKRLAALAGLSNKDQIDRLLLRPSLSQSHFLSFSGGSDKMQYFLSGNYKNEQSGTIGSGSDALTLNSRNTYKLASFLDLRTDLSANYISAKAGYSGIEGKIRTLMPYQMLQDAQGNYIYDYSGFNKIENDRLQALGYLDNGFNLLEENRQAKNTASGWGLKTRVGADWKIIKGLTLSNDFIYEKTTNDSRNLMPEKGYDVRSLVNNLTSTEAGKLVFNIPKGDVLDFRNAAYSNYALRNQLNYTNTFKEKHYINVIAGFDLRKSVNQSNKNRRLGYNDELLTGQNIDAKLLAAQGIIWWNGDRNKYDPASYEGFEFRDTREYSYYSTLAYTYDDRYTLSGSYRTDHSNLFGADPKFRKTPLWSVGASWNISNEHFFHRNTEAISNLSLRGSYGLTGNFDRLNSTTTFLVARRFINTIANDYVARLETPPNSKLRWERSKTFNLGADIGLLNNRFSLSLDYYRKFSYDLLGSQDLDPTVGLTTATINAASMVNRGVELNLKADIFRGRGFTWNSSFNLAYNKNEIIENKLVESSASISRPSGRDIYLKGYERESVWSYKWAGLDNTGRPQTFDANGNKIYVPNIGSLEYSGTYRPKVSGGWTNSFSYKGFEAMIFLAFNYGHVTRREMPNMYGYDWTGSYNDQISNRWRKPGDEQFTEIPAIPGFENLSDDYSRVATLSSNSIIDASFVRLREVQFGYRLNPKHLQKTPFKAIRIVAQMNNLYLFKANKYGIDPESVRMGGLGGGYTYALPEPIITTIGLNISL